MEHHHIADNRQQRKLARTGEEDGFEPLTSLDINSPTDFDELAQSMKNTSFGGRTLGEAVDVLYEMFTDPEVFVVGTFSGAMTPAKMGLLICEMIDRGMINAVVSTGALMTHGMVEGFGMNHFKYKFGQMNDRDLYQKGYDRIYDTLELEKNLDDLEELLDKVLKRVEPGAVINSRILNEKVGEYLNEILKPDQRAILKSAFLRKVPVYIPAFSDSEYGLDVALYNRKMSLEGKKPLVFSSLSDLEDITDLYLKQKKLGIFTIGGGVPRNWAQQIPPYLDLIRWRIRDKSNPDSYKSDPEDPYKKRFRYGVRICPEPVHWGGLSGCTYSEGVTWGKFVPSAEGGKFAEVLSDATIAWPIILKAVIQRMDKDKKNE